MKRPRRLRILAAFYVLVMLFLFGLMVDRRPPDESAVPAMALPSLRRPGTAGGPTVNAGKVASPAAGAAGGEQAGNSTAAAVRNWQELFRPSPQTARILLERALPLFWALDGETEAALEVYKAGSVQSQGLFETLFPFLAGSGSGLLRTVPGPNGTGSAAPNDPPMTAVGHEAPHESATGGQAGNGPNGLPGPGTAPGAPGGAASGGAGTDGSVGSGSSAAGPSPAGANPAPATDSPLRQDLPLVGIYHTHDYESYVSEFPGKRFPNRESLSEAATSNNERNIVRVGTELAQALSERGIGTVHSRLSNSRLGYDRAYEASLGTAQTILSRHPSVQVLLDVHRDDSDRAESTVTVGGLPVARVAIVIGKGESLPQPHWEQNYAFALDLGQAFDRRYPGLFRGVFVKPSRYNQHLLPGAMLLEIGSATNTMDEARRSVDLLAGVLTDRIRAGRYPHKTN